MARKGLARCESVGDNPLPAVRACRYRWAPRLMRRLFRVREALQIACWRRLQSRTTRPGRFSTEAVNALTRAGLPGLMLPAEAGENLNRYCSFCLGTRTWTPQRTAFRPVPRRDR